MKKSIALIVCSVFLVLAMLPMQAAAKEMTLKLASWGSAKHYAAVARVEWINEVNEACAGKIKIVDYPGGQLYGPKDMHKQIAKGAVDMGVVLQPAMLAMVPMVQGVYLPFAYDNIDEAAKAYTGESLEILEKAMAKKRLKIVWSAMTDGVQIFSNKKNIETIEDFKGLRVLSTSPIFAEIMANLGAAPDTSIPYTEQYMALKRGVSDAMANSIVGGYFQKTHEVAPLVTQIEMSYSSILFCMNLKTWNKLPKDVQDIMTSIGEKKSAYCLAAAKGWQQKFTGAMAQEGATVKTIAPEERAKIIAVAKPVWEKWAEKNGKDAKRLLELNERK